MAEKRGLVLVFTGEGKGKTSAALGLALRAVGRGLKVLMIQFIKGEIETGELMSAERLAPEFKLIQMGKGFITGTDPESLRPHREAAEHALHFAYEEMVSGRWDVIILDEINYAVWFHLISEKDLLALIDQRPAAVHLVLTGRNATQGIIGRADLVTEMFKIKHPWDQGIEAQLGLDF